MSDGIVKNVVTPKHFCSIRLQCEGGGTFLTITKDGQIVAGEGLSQDDATQAAAKMLAEKFSAQHQKQAARIAKLEEALVGAINALHGARVFILKKHGATNLAREAALDKGLAVLSVSEDTEIARSSLKSLEARKNG